MSSGEDVAPTFDAEDRPQFIEHLSKGLNYTVFDVKWIPCSARFVALGQKPRGTGTIQLYQMGKGTLELTNEAEKEAAFKCGTFGASSLEERHLATGDFNGRMSIWDLERMSAPVFTVKGHKQIINSIDGCGGQNVGVGAQEIATGSRDGHVKIWDPRVPDEPVAALKPKSGEDVRDCWAVAFGNAYNEDERVVAAGYDNGDIKLFDLKMNKVRWEDNVKNGICGLQFDRKDIEMNKLLVVGLESRFRVYDMRTYNEKKGYSYVQEQAHDSTVWIGHHLRQNRDVWATSGGNGSINIYKYSYPSQRAVKDADGNPLGVAGTVELVTEKKVSTQPVCCFDWSPDKEGLCVYGSFDQTIRVGIVTRLNTIK